MPLTANSRLIVIIAFAMLCAVVVVSLCHGTEWQWKPIDGTVQTQRALFDARHFPRILVTYAPDAPGDYEVSFSPHVGGWVVQDTLCMEGPTSLAFDWRAWRGVKFWRLGDGD